MVVSRCKHYTILIYYYYYYFNCIEKLDKYSYQRWYHARSSDVQAKNTATVPKTATFIAYNVINEDDSHVTMEESKVASHLIFNVKDFQIWKKA